MKNVELRITKTSDRVDVVRCRDCGHCFSLANADPMEPYNGDGHGFYCEAFGIDFYVRRGHLLLRGRGGER